MVGRAPTPVAPSLCRLEEPPRWRAINLIYALSVRPLDAQLSRPCTVAALARFDIGRPVLEGLELRGFVRGRFHRTDTRANIGTDDPNVTVVELTRSGITWWHRNPYQQVVRAAAHRENTPLWKLTREGDASARLQPAAIVGAVDKGYVTVFCVVLGQVQARQEDFRTRELVSTWRLRATSKGRHVMALPT